MSQGLNKTQIIGYLGRDPEGNTTQGGVTVTRFSVGVTERWRGRDDNENEHTEWYRVVAFNGVGEACAKFLGKGRLVYIEGRLRTTSYTDRNDQKRTSTELIATSVIFLDAPRTGEEPRDSKLQPAKPNSGVDAEDVPF
jgi:single-strand DNA-binding protein